AQVTLVERERERDWVRVAALFEESGAAIEGWVRATELRVGRAPAPAPARVGEAFARPPLGVCGRAPRRHEYIGPATVIAETFVRATRDGAAWATVPEDAELVVAWRTGDPWVQIIQARGLRGEGVRCPDLLQRAWAPRRNVRLQGEQ
ncbi:MAG: hypothetical protein IT378_25755, partial [Sandaracinaceae bacterium]|nr:hypothetical protein [Sandaracinaceae bacterium]